MELTRAKTCFRTDLHWQNPGHVGADPPDAAGKAECAIRYETAVASSGDHIRLAPDAYFDGKAQDFASSKDEKTGNCCIAAGFHAALRKKSCATRAT